MLRYIIIIIYEVPTARKERWDGSKSSMAAGPIAERNQGL